MAILIISDNQFGNYESDLIHLFKEYRVPYFTIHNKADLDTISARTVYRIKTISDTEIIDVSTFEKFNFNRIAELLKNTFPKMPF